MGDPSKINNIYLSPDLNILPKSGEVKDFEFDNHVCLAGAVDNVADSRSL